eukprot:748106-Hanusia_phi.AAC.1
MDSRVHEEVILSLVRQEFSNVLGSTFDHVKGHGGLKELLVEVEPRHSDVGRERAHAGKTSCT